MTLDITTDDRKRWTITDTAERRQLSLLFPSTVSPTAESVDEFIYPVDDAFSVEARNVVVEDGASATVLDADGEVWAKVGTESWTNDVPPGTYYLQVANHIKTYLRVTAPEGIEIEADPKASTVEVDFHEPVEISVGARSVHDRPTETITTTAAPEDVMTAVSYLGSALKDFGAMRSFPSLRGHPPEVELGDELHVPESLSKPDTGVVVELPPTYDHVFAVAPLAYYLGAEVVPGDRPTLRAGEFEFPLDGADGFEQTVNDVLQHVFVCDCFVRTAGPYSFGLGRQADFERETGLDPEEVFGQPLARQVETYLSVPFEAVEPFRPHWGLGAHLEPVPENVEYLPFLARDLAVVRSPSTRKQWPSVDAVTGAEATPADGEFNRSAAAVSDDAGDAFGPETPSVSGGPTDGETESPDSLSHLSWASETPSVVVPEPLETQEQQWMSDGVPLGADKPLLESYRNELDRDPVEGDIEILVVCNDDRMAAEDDAVRNLLSADTPFDVHIRPYRNLTTEELRTLLERGGEYLHYIGHIDENGFVCADGSLDVATIDTVNVDAFFLNACQSYEQGRALVDAGALAGVVTLTDVLNDNAGRTGESMARLLNNGFPLNTSLRLTCDEHDASEKYTVIGDGSLQIAQAKSISYTVDTALTGTDEVAYEFRSFVSPQFRLGAIQTPAIDDIEGWFLSGTTVEAHVDSRQLTESFTHADAPVHFHGGFHWTTDLVDRIASLVEFDKRLETSAALATDEERSTAADDSSGASQFAAIQKELDQLLDTFDTEDFQLAFHTLD
ncbi:hypothetical protein [Halorussus halophilus]|uniref:hypothetical protein n=1 Tax=Halorussus halophilus TaxID=2650975 RepID=UPI0013011B0B|nr:hypothetical protein [Halorussus halophilus]